MRRSIVNDRNVPRLVLLPCLVLFLLSCKGEPEPEREERKVSPSRSSFKNEFRAIWENATAYTLEVLDSMPADRLGTRPADSSMSFRHQLLHIESNLRELTDRYVLKKDSTSHIEHDSTVTKKELRVRLRKAFQKVRSALGELTPQQLRDTTKLFDRMKIPRTRVFLLMRDHMTHHRAQMIIALREAGVEPPSYQGW